MGSLPDCPAAIWDAGFDGGPLGVGGLEASDLRVGVRDLGDVARRGLRRQLGVHLLVLLLPDSRHQRGRREDQQDLVARDAVEDLEREEELMAILKIIPHMQSKVIKRGL